MEARLFSEKQYTKFAPVDIYLPPPLNLMIMVDGLQHKEKPRSEEKAGKRKPQADRDIAFDTATLKQDTHNRLYRLSQLDEWCFLTYIKEMIRFAWLNQKQRFVKHSLNHWCNGSS